MMVIVKMVMKKMMIEEDKEEWQILSWASDLVFVWQEQKEKHRHKEQIYGYQGGTGWGWDELGDWD